MKRFIALLLSLVCAFALFSCNNGGDGGDDTPGGENKEPTVAEKIAPYTAAINAANPTAATVNVTYVTDEYTLTSELNASYKDDGTAEITGEVDRLGKIAEGESFIVTTPVTVTVGADGTITSGEESLGTAAAAAAIKLNLDPAKLVDVRVESCVLFAKVYTADTASVLGAALGSTANISVTIANGKVASFTVEYLDGDNTVTVACSYNN